MKKIKKVLTISFALLLGFVLVRCGDDEPSLQSFYDVSGVVTYPDFSGTMQNAEGAIVYLVKDATAASTAYDLTTVVDGSGDFLFEGLEAGDYFLFVNYNTANTNIPEARIKGINFDSGAGVLFTVTDEDVTENVALVSAGQSTAFVIDTRDAGDWKIDQSHSNIDFDFPYKEENATYTGRFDDFDIDVNFDPANLAGSSISASIDLLSVNTSSPGGRDSFYDDVLTTWDYGCLVGTLGVAILDNLLPDEATRYATFDATGFSAYGDGYKATGDFTFNGNTETETVFFRLIEGFEGQSRQGVLTRYSSLEAVVTFNPLADYDMEDSNVGANDITVNISNQVNKALE